MLPKTANGRQPNSRAVVAGNNAEAIVLDLMQHWPPEGSLSVLVGRHGATNPAGTLQHVPIVRDYSWRISIVFICASHALGYYRAFPQSSLKPRHARGFLSLFVYRRIANQAASRALLSRSRPGFHA